MKRGALRVAAAITCAVGVSAIAWPVYGRAAFIHCVEILAPLGAAMTLRAHTVVSHRALLRGLRRQLAVLAVLTATQVGAALALFAALTFVSSMDAFFMALATGYAGLIGLSAARLVARRARSGADR